MNPDCDMIEHDDHDDPPPVQMKALKPTTDHIVADNDDVSGQTDSSESSGSISTMKSNGDEHQYQRSDEIDVMDDSHVIIGETGFEVADPYEWIYDVTNGNLPEMMPGILTVIR